MKNNSFRGFVTEGKFFGKEIEVVLGKNTRKCSVKICGKPMEEKCKKISIIVDAKRQEFISFDMELIQPINEDNKIEETENDTINKSEDIASFLPTHEEIKKLRKDLNMIKWENPEKLTSEISLCDTTERLHRLENILYDIESMKKQNEGGDE